MKPRCTPPTDSIHDTYGIEPKKVMSGLTASWRVSDSGAPPLNSSNCVPPTNLEMKMAWRPVPVSSAQTTHGTVVPPGVSAPAATLGSSAPCDGLALSEQASSADADAAQGPNPGGELEVSRGLVVAAVPPPTACQWKPPSAFGSATIL